MKLGFFRVIIRETSANGNFFLFPVHTHSANNLRTICTRLSHNTTHSKREQIMTTLLSLESCSFTWNTYGDGEGDCVQCELYTHWMSSTVQSHEIFLKIKWIAGNTCTSSSFSLFTHAHTRSRQSGLTISHESRPLVCSTSSVFLSIYVVIHCGDKNSKKELILIVISVSTQKKEAY